MYKKKYFKYKYLYLHLKTSSTSNPTLSFKRFRRIIKRLNNEQETSYPNILSEIHNNNVLIKDRKENQSILHYCFIDMTTPLKSIKIIIDYCIENKIVMNENDKDKYTCLHYCVQYYTAILDENDSERDDSERDDSKSDDSKSDDSESDDSESDDDYEYSQDDSDDDILPFTGGSDTLRIKEKKEKEDKLNKIIELLIKDYFNTPVISVDINKKTPFHTAVSQQLVKVIEMFFTHLPSFDVFFNIDKNEIENLFTSVLVTNNSEIINLFIDKNYPLVRNNEVNVNQYMEDIHSFGPIGLDYIFWESFISLNDDNFDILYNKLTENNIKSLLFMILIHNDSTKLEKILIKLDKSFETFKLLLKVSFTKRYLYSKRILSGNSMSCEYDLNMAKILLSKGAIIHKESLLFIIKYNKLIYFFDFIVENLQIGNNYYNDDDRDKIVMFMIQYNKLAFFEKFKFNSNKIPTHRIILNLPPETDQNNIVQFLNIVGMKEQLNTSDIKKYFKDIISKYIDEGKYEAVTYLLTDISTDIPFDLSYKYLHQYVTYLEYTSENMVILKKIINNYNLNDIRKYFKDIISKYIDEGKYEAVTYLLTEISTDIPFDLSYKYLHQYVTYLEYTSENMVILKKIINNYNLNDIKEHFTNTRYNIRDSDYHKYTNSDENNDIEVHTAENIHDVVPLIINTLYSNLPDTVTTTTTMIDDKILNAISLYYAKQWRVHPTGNMDNDGDAGGFTRSLNQKFIDALMKDTHETPSLLKEYIYKFEDIETSFALPQINYKIPDDIITSSPGNIITSLQNIEFFYKNIGFMLGRIMRYYEFYNNYDRLSNVLSEYNFPFGKINIGYLFIENDIISLETSDSSSDISKYILLFKRILTTCMCMDDNFCIYKSNSCDIDNLHKINKQNEVLETSHIIDDEDSINIIKEKLLGLFPNNKNIENIKKIKVSDRSITEIIDNQNENIISRFNYIEYFQLDNCLIDTCNTQRKSELNDINKHYFKSFDMLKKEASDLLHSSNQIKQLKDYQNIMTSFYFKCINRGILDIMKQNLSIELSFDHLCKKISTDCYQFDRFKELLSEKSKELDNDFLRELYQNILNDESFKELYLLKFYQYVTGVKCFYSNIKFQIADIHNVDLIYRALTCNYSINIPDNDCYSHLKQDNWTPLSLLKLRMDEQLN